MKSGVKLVCPCCHFETGLSNQAYFSCPHSVEGEQHILQKKWAPDSTSSQDVPLLVEKNPFLRFKKHFFSWHLSEYLNHNYESTVNRIQEQLKTRAGTGFQFTPLSRESRLMNAIGLTSELWAKNETVQPAGSHKIRHMMGSLLYLENFYEDEKPKLAIYSCGNAALAAAAMAQAGGYPLRVFLPTGVDFQVKKSISRYGAEVIECPRVPGQHGDPSYHAFTRAVRDGFLPFSCSGPDNWSNIEGGQTLMLEVLDQMSYALPSSIYLQVGGGALASSAIQTLFEQYEAGNLGAIPRIHAVQTHSCFPVIRTYFALLQTLAHALNLSMSEFNLSAASIETYANERTHEIEDLAETIREKYQTEIVQKVLHDATLSHRWNRVWEEEPHSLAHGILDDFTYDWYTIICGMFRSGGWPVIISEEDILEAHTLAREHTDIPVDPTGTSGFAGLLHQRSRLNRDESALVLFTGRDRSIA